MKKYENAKKYFREKKKLIYDDRTLGMKSIDLRRCHKLFPNLIKGKIQARFTCSEELL